MSNAANTASANPRVHFILREFSLSSTLRFNSSGCRETGAGNTVQYTCLKNTLCRSLQSNNFCLLTQSEKAEETRNERVTSRQTFIQMWNKDQMGANRCLWHCCKINVAEVQSWLLPSYNSYSAIFSSLLVSFTTVFFSTVLNFSLSA